MKACVSLATMALTGTLAAACGDDPPASPPPAPASMSPPAPSTTAAADGRAELVQRMPQVTGVRLSDAEELLLSAGFTEVTSMDVTGQGRMPIEGDNWTVERQEPAAGTSVEVGVTVTLGVRKPTDGQGAPPVRTGVVPDVVCLDLQKAQEAMRKAGFYLVFAEDGSGHDRYPLVDRNWVVVGQSVTPGSSQEPTVRIELTVVKYGEPTGSSGCRS